MEAAVLKLMVVLIALMIGCAVATDLTISVAPHADEGAGYWRPMP
jgi:hypothetical protein